MPFKIKAHDRRPSIQTTLGFDGGGVPALTGSVAFIMRATGSTGPPAIKAPAVVVDADAGTVRYDWQAGDTDLPGEYLAEWEVTDTAGLKMTFPTDAYDDVTIYADLDSA